MLDTSSGASISIRQILLQLHRAGWDIDIVGATVFDDPKGGRRLGPHWDTIRAAETNVITLHDGPLLHRLVKTASPTRQKMTLEEANHLYFLYTARLAEFSPDVVFYYGGMPSDFHIPNEARARGIPSVAYLVNANYQARRWCRDVDLIVTDTQATADLYAAQQGFRPVPVGKFIDPADVIAPRHERRVATLINPSWAKGAGIVAMLALALERRRPDIPFEVVESRGNWTDIVRAVTLACEGQPRDALANVTVTPNTDRVAEVYARSRIVLGLSQWWESGSRVLAEAMLNGIPAMVSNHGGSPEMVGKGGIVVDLPPKCHEAPFDNLPRPELLTPIVELLERVWDDEPFYLALMTRALQQGISLHQIAHSTDRLIAALKPLTDRRAGDNDHARLLTALHKHGLTEGAEVVAPAAAARARLAEPILIEVTRRAGAAAFLFSDAAALAAGKPEKILSGGLSDPASAADLSAVLAQKDFLAFSTATAPETTAERARGLKVRPISYMTELLTGTGTKLPATARDALPLLSARLQNFAMDGAAAQDSATGFVLFGNMAAASSRLHGQYVSEWLNRSARHRAIILHRPDSQYEPDLPEGRLAAVAWAAIAGNLSTAVFQKTAGPVHQRLMRLMARLGVAVVFVDCDLRSDYGFLDAVDHVIVPTEFLAARYRLAGFDRVSTIPDTIDFRSTLPPRQAPACAGRGVWVGTADKFEHFASWRTRIATLAPAIRIDAISDHSAAEIQWRTDLFPEILGSYDFGFVTLADDDWSAAKSPNRAVLLMANGLPTLAENRPTYAGVICHGTNGFLFDTAADVVRDLGRLADPAVWTSVAAAGVEACQARFGMAQVGPMWERALDLAKSRAASGERTAGSYHAPCIAPKHMASPAGHKA